MGRPEVCRGQPSEGRPCAGVGASGFARVDGNDAATAQRRRPAPLARVPGEGDARRADLFWVRLPRFALQGGSRAT